MSDSLGLKNEVSSGNEPALIARRQRLDDAMHLRRPDRVPVFPLSVNYYPTLSSGISNMEAMASPEKTFDILRAATIQHDWDAAASCVGTLVAFRPLEILGITRIKCPGRDLSENQPYKWVEAEYMAQSEYDEFLFDPTGFVLNKIWPRISSTLAPVCEMLHKMPFSFLQIANPLILPRIIGDLFSTDQMDQFIAKAKELAEENEKNRERVVRYNRQMTELGYPLYPPVTIYTAFDWLSINLRGFRGILMDMYEVPRKLSAALDFVCQATLNHIIKDSGAGGVKQREVFIRMNHNAAELMSEDQFMRFYWPHLKTLASGMIDAGLTPVLVFEGDCTSILHLLAELPRGKAVGHFSGVDRKKAKDLIGEIMCFWGNVPADLLRNGTVQEVKEDVKELIDMFGENGGLIIDGAAGIPDYAKPENVQAMTTAAHEYGVYKPVPITPITSG